MLFQSWFSVVGEKDLHEVFASYSIFLVTKMMLPCIWIYKYLYNIKKNVRYIIFCYKIWVNWQQRLYKATLLLMGTSFESALGNIGSRGLGWGLLGLHPLRSMSQNKAKNKNKHKNTEERKRKKEWNSYITYIFVWLLCL